MDSFTTTQEVVNAIKKVIGDTARDPQVTLLKANNKELKIAIVQLNSDGTRKLIETRHIMIGWVKCRVKKGFHFQDVLGSSAKDICLGPATIQIEVHFSINVEVPNTRQGTAWLQNNVFLL